MPIVNRFAELAGEIAAWRQDIHAHPELLFEVHRTAALVEEKLKEFGVDEVVTGLGRTGVVGVIKGRRSTSGRVIGMRADMDALPMQEMTGKPHASKTDGMMHACGHDGHTAMLLGAAKYLAETRNFNGTAVVIFQPAEEGGGGGKEMVDDGMMERFGVEEVYGMHNMPGMPIGQFAIRHGPLMAAADFISATIHGIGGHAARPHFCVDPITTASACIQAVQNIVSRAVDPLHSAVISITQFNSGTADNVIPASATFSGTVRTLLPETRDFVEKRLGEVIESTAAAHGATSTYTYERGYPVLINHDEQTDFAGDIARKVAGDTNVDMETMPVMGGEDFSFMLNSRPGAFIFMGNGDTAQVHHPEYDFSDEAIPVGCSYWVELIQTAMPLND